jgi:fatty-acyl-CoA synthase
MYTSGTTAHPKGCVTLNRSLVDNASAIAERFAIPSDDRWWDPLPMFHMGAILLMSAVFSRGGTFISTVHFDPEEAFDTFERHRPTVLYPLFPTITLTLLHHDRFADCSFDALRVITNVSPPDIQRAIQAAFPHAVLISAYGMTELCGTLAYNRLDDSEEQRTTTCGHLLPGWEGRIVHPDTGEPVPANVRGELVARGPNLFAGYFHDPAQTGASIDADGWFHTGDHCSMDAEGLLLFHGRLKDVLKVGGENVSALEVESFLSTHPAIKLAQVVGIPDDRLMEVPAAFVELAPGATLTEQQVIDHCEGRIARFKTPRHVRFVTDWPMSSTKIQKFRLREQLIAELGR